jgi:hypothetical protein
MSEQNKSEVACLLQEIDERNRAARRGISDYQTGATHEAILKKMEQGAVPVFALFDQGRFEEGVLLWDSWVNQQRALDL